MPKIFVANFSGHNYSRALDTVPDAKIVPLTMGNINPLLVDRLAYQMAEKLHEEEATQDDHLLLSGTPVVNSVATAVWFSRFTQMNILIWDSRNDAYYPATLEQGNLQNIFNMIEEHLPS